MTKYRIMKSSKNRYKIQFKWFCFWCDVKSWYGDFGILRLFESKEEAKKLVEELKKTEEPESWSECKFTSPIALIDEQGQSYIPDEPTK